MQSDFDTIQIWKNYLIYVMMDDKRSMDDKSIYL